MLTKYKIKGRYPEAKIEEVEVLRETEHCIFVPDNKTKSNPTGERKELKMTEWTEHYDTWEAAHAALTAKAERQVTNARRALEIANGFAGNVKGMRHNAIGQRGAEGASAAPTGCASNGTTEKEE